MSSIAAAQDADAVLLRLCAAGSSEALEKHLVEEGRDVSLPLAAVGATPLHVAAAKGRKRCRPTPAHSCLPMSDTFRQSVEALLAPVRDMCGLLAAAPCPRPHPPRVSLAGIGAVRVLLEQP